MNLVEIPQQLRLAGEIIYCQRGLYGLMQAAEEGKIPPDTAEEASEALNKLNRTKKRENRVLAALVTATPLLAIAIPKIFASTPESQMLAGWTTVCAGLFSTSAVSFEKITTGRKIRHVVELVSSYIPVQRAQMTLLHNLNWLTER